MKRRWIGGILRSAKPVVIWLFGVDSPKRFLLVSATLLLGGSWLFFGILEDVLTHDPLVDVDVFIYHLIQVLRTPVVDRVMVAVTELGDMQVLLPVALIALLWFVAHRAWLSAGYWLLAIVVAELFTKILKLTLHRQRPGILYGGIEQFSFPSGHATMSVVVFGFLAYLLCRDTRTAWHKAILLIAIVLITSIALSRLYLGVHWMSDVMGGVSFGAAWVAALAIAYEYQSRDQLRSEGLAIVIAAALIVGGLFHITSSFDGDITRYAPSLRAMPSDALRDG